MNSPLLDRRITLQYSVPTRDAAGGSVPAWIEAATVWAGKLDSRGGRLYAAEAKHYETSLIYRIRHRVDVAEGWRLVHGDDVFEIVHAAEVGRAEHLDLFLRGIDVTAGGALRVLLLEGTGAASFLQLEDGTPLLLETAA